MFRGIFSKPEYGRSSSAETDLLSLLHAVSGNLDAIIIPEWNRSFSYHFLRDQVSCMAERLAGMGIRPGARVATVFNNGLAAIVAFLAASMAGTAMPLNPKFLYHEFCFYLQHLNARLLLCPSNGADLAREAAASLGIPIGTVEVDSSCGVRLAGGSARTSLSVRSPNDAALLLCTSGSTAYPKRVPLRHSNLIAACKTIVHTYSLTPQDVSLCIMPLFHIHGLIASVLSTLSSGGTAVVPEKFNAFTLWRLIKEHRISWYSAVPTFHQLILARLHGERRPARIRSLRFIRSCSAPLRPQLMQNLEELYEIPVLQAYGMTEASHQIASNPLPPGIRKPGSVGPATGIEIQIMNELGSPVDTGSVGEVAIKGPSVMSGYNDDPEANACAFTNGWLRTGDQGTLDQDGYLKLTGRIKELINCGGEKIAPQEIDEILLAHPAVAEAVAFGMPDWDLVERVSAAVVLHEPQSESALLSYCRERLARFKCPKKIHILNALPKTASGKIQRRMVAASLLGQATPSLAQ